ncbi:MAG: hypothetical protein O2946_06290, partial [Planctomycetota bacterium]|nr:hypothetical protein [Planctomycetota bacterium]
MAQRLSPLHFRLDQHLDLCPAQRLLLAAGLFKAELLLDRRHLVNVRCTGECGLTGRHALRSGLLKAGYQAAHEHKVCREAAQACGERMTDRWPHISSSRHNRMKMGWFCR